MKKETIDDVLRSVTIALERRRDRAKDAETKERFEVALLRAESLGYMLQGIPKHPRSKKKPTTQEVAFYSLMFGFLLGDLRMKDALPMMEKGLVAIEGREKSRAARIDNQYGHVEGVTAEDKRRNMELRLRQLFQEFSAAHPKSPRKVPLGLTQSAFEAEIQARGETGFKISPTQVRRLLGPLPKLKTGRKPGPKSEGNRPN